MSGTTDHPTTEHGPDRLEILRERVEVLERNAGLDEDFDLVSLADDLETLERRIAEIDNTLAAHLTEYLPANPFTLEQRQRTKALGVARDTLASKQVFGSNIGERAIEDLITLADWILGSWAVTDDQPEVDDTQHPDHIDGIE
jgi:hypothetical protein